MEVNVKTKLEQVLARCLNGREVAVWGTPTRLLLRALKGYSYHIAENVDVRKHYVVAVNEDDETNFFMDGQSKAFKHPYDFLTFGDIGEGLPFEWECHGVRIGREPISAKGLYAVANTATSKGWGILRPSTAPRWFNATISTT
jgi:aminocyclitol acetyltransferase